MIDRPCLAQPGPIIDAREQQAIIKNFGVSAEVEGVTDALSCPQCGAATRADAAWCSLCYAPMAGGIDPLTAPLEELLGAGGSTALMTSTLPVTRDSASSVEPVESGVADVAASHGRHALVPVSPESEGSSSPGEVPTEASSDISEVDVMLAMLAAEHRQQDPSVELVDRMGDKGARVMLIVGGTIAVAVVALVIMAVLGALT
ncbi:MAG: zinc ribbon domain-containing protein [Candidatus Nanopelagicales bacterium]